MKTSRQRLFQYLEKKQVVTVQDISLALKMTPANARHHLSILIDQGNVEVVGKLIGKGRGRPFMLYKSVKPSLNNNLVDLTRILIQELFKSKSNRDREQQLKIIAHKLINWDIPNSKQQYKILNDTVHQLNQMNYNARWEAHHEAPHIILDNCPYLEIVGDFPEICKINKYILEEMLRKKVSQTVKLESTKSGFIRCVFIVIAD
jgi:predicted ArsR family transcriptional regulator